MTRRQRQTTWVSGGVGLILSGVTSVVQSTLGSDTGFVLAGVVADVIFAGAVLLLAVGMSRDASVVGRKPLGVTALAVVGVWPLGWFLVTRAVLNESGATIVDSALGYVALLIPFAAGLLGGTWIVRARVVSNPWRWAPLWALGTHIVTWSIPQIVFVSQRPENLQGFASVFQSLGTLATLAGTIGLGIISVSLAAKERPESVEILSTR